MSDPADPALASPAPAPARAAPRRRVDWVGELRALLWIALAIYAVWSFIAKPFYIPSNSMTPTLVTGDRLVVSKFPYGWSYASLAFHPLGFTPGRLFGHLPARGDVVIVVPPGERTDYIKRVIGLPGDRLMGRHGQLVINGVPVPRERMPDAVFPVDANFPGPADPNMEACRETDASGRAVCRLPVYRETLPNGVRYDTADLGYQPDSDDWGPVVVPAGHVWLMGDNRDDSADSRVASERGGLGGPVPVENLGGRAEFITFTLDGSASWWNPISWIRSLRHDGRSWTSLRPEQAPAR